METVTIEVPALRAADDPVPGLNAVPAPTARCVECRQPVRAVRRCPDCRAPVHQRGQAGHACAAKRARVAALEAEMPARLVRDRVVLTLQVDSARGSPQSWDWPSPLRLRAPDTGWSSRLPEWARWALIPTHPRA